MAPPGPARSTVAKQLARRLGYRLLDTGAIYRAVALVAQRARYRLWTDAVAPAPRSRAMLDIQFDFVGDKNHVFVRRRGRAAPRSARPRSRRAPRRCRRTAAVRAALLDLQRRLGAGGGVVVEGRDTGTVVFPDAEAKFFLTATDEERARRRVAELRPPASRADLEVTLREIRERDQRDSEPGRRSDGGRDRRGARRQLDANPRPGCGRNRRASVEARAPLWLAVEPIGCRHLRDARPVHLDERISSSRLTIHVARTVPTPPCVEGPLRRSNPNLGAL